MTPDTPAPLHSQSQIDNEAVAFLAAQSFEFGQFIGQILMPTKKADKFEALSGLNQLDLAYRRAGIPAEFLMMLRGIIDAIEANR
jgi:hypothetical protein